MTDARVKIDRAHSIQKTFEGDHLRAIVVRRGVRQVAENSAEVHGVRCDSSRQLVDEGCPF